MPPWSSLAQVPARQPLNGRYKGSVPRGTPRPRYLSKFLHRTVFRCLQEPLPIGDKSQQGSIGYDGIIFDNPHVKTGHSTRDTPMPR
jgi:hypothetical protein